ncbi:dehydratase, partial [Rhodoblastus acidophilus]|uniref:MaoC/PaaZ C-terminal domain-containing protein n=1 Tax=Candidatus Rhodoblastus alkanivorans TaxID=2954117 RepID=UPI0026766B1A
MTDTLAHPPPAYLEDLRVGQHFVSGSHEVTAEAIKTFARQFDPQPFHLDDAAAEGTFFGGLAASGWHVAAITMKLLVGDGAFIANGLIGAGGEIAWPRPTPVS